MNNKENLLERRMPLDLINEESLKEKNGRPPISEMHYYFTRKPLIASRMAIVGAILDYDSIRKPDDFNKLIGIDSTLKKRAFKNISSELMAKIKSKYPEGVTILDPFAGGGMIPFEALRLGLDVVAMDYNPVSFLILKGTLEYPLKYGGNIDKNTGESKLYEDVKKYSEEIFAKLKQELSIFYPKHGQKQVRAYIHAWATKCPTCRKITPLVNNWRLDAKNGINLDYCIVDGNLEYSITKGQDERSGNIKRGTATCLYCTNQIENDHIVEDISKNEREILLAVYLEDGSFELPTKDDMEALYKVAQFLKDNSEVLSKFVPTELLPDDMRSLPTKKYLQCWHRLFSCRQMLILSSFARETRRIVKELSAQDKEYAAAIGTYLSMVLAKHVDRNSRCARWDNSSKKIGEAWANRGLSMMWSHGEPNPFVKFSGSLIGNIKDILSGLKFAVEELNHKTLIDKSKKSSCEIYQGSLLSWRSKRKFKFIVTDPPYYDDVPYPELMQFFQVWHHRTVGDLLNIPATPSISEELSVGRERDEKIFEKRLAIAIKSLYDLLEDDGILVMFYAHSSIEGWKYVLESLRKTGFHVTSTIALMTENKENLIARGKSSVFHSLVITARKRQTIKTATLMDVEEEIRRKIEERYPDLESIYGKDRMNLMIAASGMVIETITEYTEITSFAKNTADYALEIGQRFLIEAFAKRTLNLNNIDPKTMVYSWFRHSLQDLVPYSEFNQTLKALGTAEQTLTDIIERPKKDGSSVRLLDFMERGVLEIDGMEPLIAQSLIDAVHIVLRGYIRGGITAAKKSVDSSPFGRKTILNMIEALGKIYGTKNNYKEGEICKKFMAEWNAIYGNGQKELY